MKPDSASQPTLDEIKRWPATVNVGPASVALGISRSLGYELIARGEFPAKTLTVGARIKVLTASLIATLTDGETPRADARAGTAPVHPVDSVTGDRRDVSGWCA